MSDKPRITPVLIEIVRNGGEPMGVIRDPSKNTIIDIPVVNERIGLNRPQKREPVHA